MEKEKKFRMMFIMFFIICILGAIFLIIKFYNVESESLSENKMTLNYIKTTSNFNNQSISVTQNDYLFVLSIPSIGLKKGVSENNKVDDGISINEILVMPSLDDEGMIILSSHSGNGSNAYFNNLNKLDIYDEVYIYYNGLKFVYEVADFELIDKSGTMVFDKKYTLTLVTCDIENKQLIIYLNLLSSEEY